jgi:hypothetical protein
LQLMVKTEQRFRADVQRYRDWRNRIGQPCC